jgi:hypothetical protein
MGVSGDRANVLGISCRRESERVPKVGSLLWKQVLAGSIPAALTKCHGVRSHLVMVAACEAVLGGFDPRRTPGG